MDTRFVSTLTLSINILLDTHTRGTRNPMDLASILNPLLTPLSSDREEEWDKAEEQVYKSLSSYDSCCSAPRPMEANGEVLTRATWEHHKRNLPALPPMQLTQEPCRLVNLAHRPAQGHRMTQIAERRSESDAVRQHPRPSSHSPHPYHDRHDRRGSYPHLSIALRCPGTSPSPSLKSEISRGAEGPVFGKKKKKPKRKRTGGHNNWPYTQEQLQWLQYHLGDRGFNYAGLYNQAGHSVKFISRYFSRQSPVYNGWDIQFPGDYRDHKQAFSSRLYCENIYPMLDNNDELVRGCDGKPIITTIGVRKREDPEFADFPFKLWDKNPKWALYWDWVLPEHKAMAQKILERRDLDESQLRKERSRRAIRMYEAEAPTKKGWFATPALHAAAVQTSPSPERAMLRLG
ncbi:hypothetical protein ACEPPN_001160 [Leptodophora sp. 'Broadleaf-Isolate-01']